MDTASIFIVFILVWWLVLFMVLPWGVEMQGVNDDNALPAAPKKTNLKKKLLITTAISIVLSAIALLVINSSMFDFRTIAIDMYEEDMLK